MMKYRPELPYVIKNVNLSIKAGTSTAVIGRTGAGKSSLITILLRLVQNDNPQNNNVNNIQKNNANGESNCIQGKISLFDGKVDLTTIPLQKLRGEIVSVIPQEPLLFSGPIRDSLVSKGAQKNTDTDDTEIYSILEQAELLDFVTQRGGLDDFHVDTTGTELSFGQKQLLCVARALLRKNTCLLLCDEATSSLDKETDRKIQELLTGACKIGNIDCNNSDKHNENEDGNKNNNIKNITSNKNFSNRPPLAVISIVHTLDHILGLYDNVLVMDDGKVAQFGDPKQLAEDDGIFKEMLATKR